MKSRKWGAVILAGVMLLGSINTLGATNKNKIKVFVNSERIYFAGAAPYVDTNNRTLVPVRFVSNSIGAETKWDSANKKITIIDGDKEIVLTVGSQKITVNGEAKTLDTAPTIKEGSTFVPLRFISEDLGREIKWDQAKKSIYLTVEGDFQTDYETANAFRTAGGFMVPIDRVEAHTIDCEDSWIVTMDSDLGVWGYKEPSEIDGEVLGFGIVTESTDYTAQFNDIEMILSQGFSKEVVNKIMAFVRQYNGTQQGGSLEFEVGDYKIRAFMYNTLGISIKVKDYK